MAVFPSDSIRTKNWGSEVLTDSDLEAQLDLLHAYFQAALNATTGHSHDGSSNQGPKLTTLGTLAATLALNFAKGADTASATTTDIGAIAGNYCDITGTTTITGLGTVQAGTWRAVRFTGALTLTHNGTSLMLPTAANITTVSGDTALFVSLGSGNWKCLFYQRYDGAALTGFTAATAKSGSIIQSLYDVSGSLDSTTTVLPYDNSLPDSTEGKASDLSVTITPNADGNTIEVNACVMLGSSSGSPPIVAALFEGTTCVAYQAANTSDLASVVLFYRKAGSVGTSAITYTVRFGPGSAGTCVYNGDLSGTVLGSTATKSYLKVNEIKG